MKPQPRVIATGMTDEQMAAVREAQAVDQAFYRRTGHCGMCAKPGPTCECPAGHHCGCWDLHQGNRNRDREVESLPMFSVADVGPRKPRPGRSNGRVW